MADDFTMKPMVDPVGIARLAQDQQLKKAELERQQKMDNFNMLQQTAQQVGNLVSASVEASKARQRKDMINSLSSSLANKVPNMMTPQQGPVVEGAAPLPPVMSPDIDRQNAVRSAVQISPDAFAKQLAEQVLPGAAQGSFGGGVPVRNSKTGERSFLQLNKLGQAQLANGQAFSPEWQREYADAVIQDPVNQNILRVPKNTDAPASSVPTPERTDAIPYNKKSLKERTEIASTIKELRADDLFQTSERTLQTIGNIKSVLNQDLTVASGAIKSLASRVIAGEKGVLTDKDVERQLGTDVSNRFFKLIRGAYDGKLTDQDYRELQTIIGQSTERAAEQYEATQQQNIESLMTQFDMTEKEAKVLLKYRDPAKVLAVQGKKPVQPVERDLGVTPPQGGGSLVDTSAIEAELKRRGL